MSVDTPQVLVGFLVFIPLIILEVYHYHKHRPFLGLFVSAVPLDRDTRLRELRFRYFFSCFLFGIFLACIIIALAGPRWGQQLVMEYRRGVDVVLAFDLSRSMEVQDIRDTPRDSTGVVVEEDSRLNRAIRIALEVVEASGGIRCGAAIGKGSGILAVPLTYDMETVLSFLQGLSSTAITGRGTNLETLIDAASGAFQESLPTQRMIILFSDGESWSGSIAAALGRVMDGGITITALGLGTETGGMVPYVPLLNTGEPAPPSISYRREDVLRNMAERTGGLYVDGNRNDAADQLIAHIRSFSPESGINGYHLETQAQWPLFVIIALLSLGGSKLLEKRWRNRV